MSKLALLGGAPVRTQPFDLRLSLTDADREGNREGWRLCFEKLDSVLSKPA